MFDFLNVADINLAVGKTYLVQPFNQCGSFLVCDSKTTPDEIGITWQLVRIPTKQIK